MNTTKIASLYNPKVAQLLSIDTPEAIHELRQHLLRRREDCILQTDYSVRVRQFTLEGININQLCSKRVFDWIYAEMPAVDNRQAEDETWSAVTMDFTGSEKGEFNIRFSTRADFAAILRGVQNYQRKLDRQTNRLIAQLRTYHYLQAFDRALKVALAESEPKPRFMALRRRLAGKVQQVAAAAQNALLGKGQAI